MSDETDTESKNLAGVGAIKMPSDVVHFNAPSSWLDFALDGTNTSEPIFPTDTAWPMELLNICQQRCICHAMTFHHYHELADMDVEDPVHEVHVHPIEHAMLHGADELRCRAEQQAAKCERPAQTSLQLRELPGRRTTQPVDDRPDCARRVQDQI